MKIATTQQNSSNTYKSNTLEYTTAQDDFKFKVDHIYDNHREKETIDSLQQKYPHIWDKTLSDVCDCLTKSNKYGVLVTYIIEYVAISQVSQDTSVTCALVVCDHCPLKS